jgi:K+-transporting ATPase KdpF subunit
MSVTDVIGLVLAVVLAIYLIVALLEPEKFQ